MFESLPAAGAVGNLVPIFPCPPLPLLAMGLQQILPGREFPMASLELEVGFQGKREGRSRLVL